MSDILNMTDPRTLREEAHVRDDGSIELVTAVASADDAIRIASKASDRKARELQAAFIDGMTVDDIREIHETLREIRRNKQATAGDRVKAIRTELEYGPGTPPKRTETTHEHVVGADERTRAALAAAGMALADDEDEEQEEGTVNGETTPA